MWNKVFKLREGHQLLARFLAPFATDGTLLIPNNTSSFMKEIKQYSSQAGGKHLQIAVSGGDDCREEKPEMDSQPVRLNP